MEASYRTTQKEQDESMNLTPQQRVANGVKLLNEEMPGWYNKINLNTLRVQSSFSCPLGQLFGDYLAGINQLLDNPHVAEDLSTEPFSIFPSVKYGFFARRYFDDEDFNALTEEWKKAVEIERNQ